MFKALLKEEMRPHSSNVYSIAQVKNAASQKSLHPRSSKKIQPHSSNAYSLAQVKIQPHPVMSTASLK